MPWCIERVRAGGNATVYANVHVGVGDRDATVDYARFDLFSYVVADAYAQGFARAGFSDEVEAVRTAHASGDRAAAVAGVSNRMLDAISIVGDEKLVASAVAAYREAGWTCLSCSLSYRGTAERRRWNPRCEPLAIASTVDRRGTGRLLPAAANGSNSQRASR